jgi:membrane protein insertase Oxa1/YidC/SpoIIIJ
MVQKIIYAIVFFFLVAVGTTIYGQSLLKPKNNQSVVMNPTSSQKTNAWLLMILPWFIPLGLALYYVYSNQLTPTQKYEQKYSHVYLDNFPK